MAQGVRPPPPENEEAAIAGGFKAVAPVGRNYFS
jgi:hypothetical protein